MRGIALVFENRTIYESFSQERLGKIVDFDYVHNTPNVPQIHALLELVLLCALVSRDFTMAENILAFGKSRMYLLGATNEVCKFLLALDTQPHIDQASSERPSKLHLQHWAALIEKRMLLRFIEYKVDEGETNVEEKEPKYLKVSDLLVLGHEMSLTRSCLLEIWIQLLACSNLELCCNKLTTIGKLDYIFDVI